MSFVFLCDCKYMHTDVLLPFPKDFRAAPHTRTRTRTVSIHILFYSIYLHTLIQLVTLVVWISNSTVLTGFTEVVACANFINMPASFHPVHVLIRELLLYMSKLVSFDKRLGRDVARNEWNQSINTSYWNLPTTFKKYRNIFYPCIPVIFSILRQSL